jgi:hypothetical protein
LRVLAISLENPSKCFRGSLWQANKIEHCRISGSVLKMEIVRDDGSVFDLKEGEKRELGRFSVLSKKDKSVSRIHLVFKLSRPVSKKGKEAVGKSTALKLQWQVVGKNPICMINASGSEAEQNPRPVIHFAGSSEMGWLDPGDKFSLSIKDPFFFTLRECSPGGLRANDISVENSLKGVAERGTDREAVSLEEEEGIARAVARRQRRRLERDLEQQRLRNNEHQQSQKSNGLDRNADRVEPFPESNGEVSVLLSHQSNVLGPVDPVKGTLNPIFCRPARLGKPESWQK